MKANRILNEEMQGQKLTNFLVGYVLGLAALFVAFEYSQRVVKTFDEDIIYNNVIVEDDMIPITFNQPVLSPPPAAAPTVAEFLNVVDDKVELLEDEIISPEEMNLNTNRVVNPYPFVPGVIETPTPEPIDPGEIIPVPEIDAKFPGDINLWLSEHIKYPVICQEQGVQGRVVLSFVVEKDGSITDVQVVRSPNEQLSNEAIRVVHTMPNWIPARQGNKPARSRFHLPVLFRLN